MNEPDIHSLGNLEACLARSAALHHHLCPRQVLGARLGLHAGEVLGLGLPRSDKRLVTLIETDGCLTDGVSAATGCWLGRRTLRLIDFGKVAATFIDTHTERAVRIWPHPEARRRAAAYAPHASDSWHAQLAAYQIMPAEDLLCVAPVTLTISLNALLSRPGLRVICAVCGEEIMNQREVHLGDQAVCRACAGDRYYAAAVSRPAHWPVLARGRSESADGPGGPLNTSSVTAPSPGLWSSIAVFVALPAPNSLTLIRNCNVACVKFITMKSACDYAE